MGSCLWVMGGFSSVLREVPVMKEAVGRTLEQLLVLAGGGVVVEEGV